MEALCPVRAQASSPSSSFVFRLSSMADDQTTPEETSKNRYIQFTDDADNNANDTKNVSDDTQEDFLTEHRNDAGTGYSGNISAGAMAPDSDTAQTYVRPRKPTKKGLKRLVACKK